MGFELITIRFGFTSCSGTMGKVHVLPEATLFPSVHQV